ncbi:helix-turn-helix domain-containing protein [Sphingomonas sp. 35-24ZXX]|uniref:helix-turn-helix domain-containing protein n=1 Tax=Sphingomonas sp. 35-24ZXX TaxID=1545915 RepID=UPI00053BE461|nr:helix-turn-helix domain-containing protein [Sphingomonas sp. 35-24ZXX]
MERPLAVTLPDAVKLTGMSRSRLYELLQQNKIKAHKAGRRTLIPFAELEAYLASLPTFQAGA